MLNLHLTRGNHYEGVYLKLPATPGEVGEVFGWLDEVDTEAPTKIIDVVSNIPNLHRYMYRVDIDAEGALDKLQEIATMTNEISGRQRDILTGALDAESINGLDDIISVIERMDEYAYIPGVTNDKELGGHLVESGYMDFPARVRPYLDYQGIGAEYYAEHGGAYTNKGYVLHKSVIEQYLYKEQSTVFKVHLYSAQTRQSGIEPCVLELPAAHYQIEQAKMSLGVDDLDKTEIIKVECVHPFLEDLLPLEDASFGLISDMADCISRMEETDGELLKFCAALEVERPSLMIDAVDIACDMDNYERITMGAYEYGQSVLYRHGVSGELIQDIEGYMDLEKFGEDSMIADGVRQTEFGLIRRLSEPFDELGYEQEIGGM